MKPFFLTILLGCTLTIFAQSDKYASTMAATLQSMKDAKSQEDLNAVAARFERIGDAEKTQWLPYYYASFIKVRMAMQNKTEADKLADESAALLDKAENLEKNNSEIYCVRSMIATARLIVDPMTRWQTYGPESSRYLEEAKKADPTNPRPYMLQASSLRYTPENFGGGCKTAKPVAQKALSLYTAFKPASEIHPNWGKESVDEIIANCNE